MLARVKNLTEAMTKTQLFSDIAEKTKLTRRQVRRWARARAYTAR